MDARRFDGARGLANITLKEPIDWYFDEISAAQPFGKNRKFGRKRHAARASGVTISISDR